jgi:hypothetical protein
MLELLECPTKTIVCLADISRIPYDFEVLQIFKQWKNDPFLLRSRRPGGKYSKGHDCNSENLTKRVKDGSECKKAFGRKSGTSELLFLYILSPEKKYSVLISQVEIFESGIGNSDDTYSYVCSKPSCHLKKASAAQLTYG